MDSYLLTIFLSFIFLLCYVIIHKTKVNLFDFISIVAISVTPIVNLIPLIYLPTRGIINIIRKGN